MAVWSKQLALGVLIGLLGIGINLTKLGTELEENLGLYLLFHLRGVLPAPEEVVVVAIDQKSSAQLNLPAKPGLWPRNLHARLIENLVKEGAQLIVFDLSFETPSNVPEYDVELANAMSAAGNVVIVERLDMDEIRPTTSQPEMTVLLKVESSPLLPLIADAARAHASFPLPRTARVNEYWAFKASAGEAPTLPVVALQILALSVYEDFVRLLQKIAPSQAAQLPFDKSSVNVEDLIFTLHSIFAIDPEISAQMLRELSHDTSLRPENIRILRSLLRLYSNGEMHYLNFYGPPRTLRTIPYYQALQPRQDLAANYTPENDFKGKVVFIGFSATAQSEQDKIRDDYHTVFSQSDGLYLSGVEIAATALANLLEDRPIRPLPFAENLGLIFLWGLAISVAYPALRNRAAVALGIAIILLYAYSAYDQFKENGLWLPLVVPIFVQMPLALFGAVLLKFYDARRERKVLKERVSYFLPEQVIEDIERSVGPIVTNNQLVYGTCLATDAEMYTTLAEKMSPGQLSVLMNDYYATLFEPVSRHEGIVSDVVGDAMLAIWATSSGGPSLRKQACLACLDISDALERFNQMEGRPPLYTRIGLHSGEMLLGRFGALHHYEYRAVGDMVNTTNRIQGLNKYLGTRLLVSDKVVEGLDDFLTRPLGSFLLAGKTSPVRVAELMARRQEAGSEQIWLCEIFAHAIHAYESQEWPEGCYNFSEILKAFPDDGPARFYLKRCQDYRIAAPVGPWNASIRVEGK